MTLYGDFFSVNKQSGVIKCPGCGRMVPRQNYCPFCGCLMGDGAK